MSVILCGGNDEGGLGKPGGAEEAVPETGLVVGQRNGGVSFGAGRRNGDALRLHAFGIVVQGEGRIRRSGGGEPGCRRLFLNGDGRNHRPYLCPYSQTGRPAAVWRRMRSAMPSGGGRTKRGQFSARSPGRPAGHPASRCRCRGSGSARRPPADAQRHPGDGEKVSPRSFSFILDKHQRDAEQRAGEAFRSADAPPYVIEFPSGAAHNVTDQTLRLMMGWRFETLTAGRRSGCTRGSGPRAGGVRSKNAVRHRRFPRDRQRDGYHRLPLPHRRTAHRKNHWSAG